jgi:hypothetical protein
MNTMSNSKPLKVSAFVGTLIAVILAFSPAYAAQSYSQLRALHSAKCVDVAGVSTATGAAVHQWDCLGPSQYNQHWALVRIGATSYYELVARHSGKCLDVSGVSTATGALVHQWDCLGYGQHNQQVSLRSTATAGYYQLVFRHSGKCLDVSGVSTANGARLHQWDCINGQRNQMFQIRVIT